MHFPEVFQMFVLPKTSTRCAQVLLSRAIRDPERQVGEQAFLTLRDAGCVKGMMGSMFLEERIFSPEALGCDRGPGKGIDSLIMGGMAEFPLLLIIL